MLGALFAVGTEGVISSVMGDTTLPASNQRNRVNPYRSPQSGVGSREADNGDVGMGARKEANAAL